MRRVLRLTTDERDELLTAAGFDPDKPPTPRLPPLRSIRRSR